MPKITGKEILERQLATLKKILQLMKQGLPATTPTGDIIYDTNDFTTGPSREDISGFPDGYHGISMEIPTTPAEQAKAMNTVMSLVFSEDDFVNARYWGESMDPFPGLDRDMLMKAAKKWVRHTQNEYTVNISGITLYGFQSSFASEQNPSEKLQNDDDTRYVSLLKYAIVFFIDCPGEAQKPGEWFACPHQHIGSFISRHTSHIASGFMGIPDFAATGIKAAYSGDVPDNFEDEWIILPACTGHGCNGIQLPAGVRTDEPDVVLYEISSPVKVHEHVKQEPLVLSQVLMKSWTSKGEVDRPSKKNELALWNKLIEPIVKLHFKGTIHYKRIDGPEKITQDDFGALWEQYLAPIICSNIPTWVEYPQTMGQGELESCIRENVWEPETFVSEVILPLQAGMEPGLIDPFFRSLRNMMNGNTLSSFLAYIGQGRGLCEEISKTTEQQKSISIQTPHGTTWNQIRFRYVNDAHVEISHPGVETHSPYSMADLGFSTKKELCQLFETFADFQGDIDPKTMKHMNKVKANISNLRKHLQEIFPGIEGKPINKYTPKDGYCCQFKIIKS